MKNKCLSRSVLILLFAFLGLTACNTEQDRKAKDKKEEGILLVTFGSSYEAPHQTFKRIDEIAHSKFPKTTIKWAFTSDFIIKKISEGRGEGVLNGQEIIYSTPVQIIDSMINEGYSKIIAQSLHVIPGEEYEQVLKAIEEIQIQHKYLEIVLGKPLLDSDEDIEKIAKVLTEKFKENLKEGPVCFMGHGTPHIADHCYAKLEVALKKMNKNFFIGTVEGIRFEKGASSIDALLSELKTLNPAPKKVTISPLMSIVGDHANNDMNAITGETDPAEQSWRERLESEGYEVDCVMKGLADYPEIIDIWMSHLENIKK